MKGNYGGHHSYSSVIYLKELRTFKGDQVLS